MSNVYCPESSLAKAPYEYAVVRGLDVADLVSAVNDMVQSGWRAVGGISFRSDDCCYQAMYRENQYGD